MPETTIKRALLSVSNKQGLVPFATQLHQLGIELISTGGTANLLREAGIPVKEVSTLTGFPEIMDGRVKTLHPKIHGGILGKRSQHAEIAEAHAIEWIDMVVVNLYPFLETVQQAASHFEDAIEQIDIGGPALIRAAAKNMADVTIVVDPNDYQAIVETLKSAGNIPLASRKTLASKAFKHTAHYDGLIHDYLSSHDQPVGQAFPTTLSLPLTKQFDLRYGENPDQQACAYTLGSQPNGLLQAKSHQGKALSYNNLVDADAALACVREFSSPACVIVKHANPCGVAQADNPMQAFEKALAADAKSAFGGIIALNRRCDEDIAHAITQTFFEVLIAPGYTEKALEILAKKPNLRVLGAVEDPSNQDNNRYQRWHYQAIDGGFLIQEKLAQSLDLGTLTTVTKRHPSDAELSNLLFAWQVVKHVKSNAIVIARNNQTLGIGAGQVSRIDAVDLAIRKTIGPLNHAALASDAFFPFRDSIDHIAAAGIQSIIQPGGSIRDEEVIAACNEYDIAMIFTKTRCFRH